MLRETSPLQRRDGIRAAGELEAEDRHAEFVMVAPVFRTQFHECFVGNPQSFAERSQVLIDQVGAKAVVTGGHRRVRGERHFAGYNGHGLIEADAFVRHACANCFQHRETAVSLIHVIHAGSDATWPEGAHAADSQQ